MKDEEKKNKPGSGSEKRQLKKVVRVRMSNESFAGAQRWADDFYGGSMSAYFRFLDEKERGLPAPRKTRRKQVKLPDDIGKQLTKINGRLGRLNGRVNQLALARNRGRYPGQHEIKAAQQDIEIMRTAVLSALGVRDVAIEEGKITIKVNPGSPVSPPRGGEFE